MCFSRGSWYYHLFSCRSAITLILNLTFLTVRIHNSDTVLAVVLVYHYIGHHIIYMWQLQSEWNDSTISKVGVDVRGLQLFYQRFVC